jgi:hypothetical protein
MIWIQRDGTPIEVSEMTPEHLNNALNLCRRRFGPLRDSLSSALAMQAFSYASTAPDGAALAAEESANFYLSEKGKDELLAERNYSFRELLEAKRKELME